MPRKRGDSVRRAFNIIVEKISSYDLPSGSIVSDLQLSNELNISRTPIREAMQQLIDKGLLERTDTKVIVKPITTHDINEIFQVRDAIELMSVRLIIENGGLTQENKEELSSIHSGLSESIKCGNVEKNFFYDSLFHKKLVEFSGNSRLKHIYNNLTLQSERLRWLTILTPSIYSSTLDEHSEIIQCFLDLDLNTLTETLDKHINGAKNNYINILSNSQWLKISSHLKEMKL